MPLTQQSVEHTGEERREVRLTYSPEDLRSIERLTLPGQIVPDTIVLVWVRRVGEDWQRYTKGQHGSRAVGNVKLTHPSDSAMGVRRSREIFSPSLGDIRRWAEYLPGLRNAIVNEEAQLPTPSLLRAQAGLTR